MAPRCRVVGVARARRARRGTRLRLARPSSEYSVLFFRLFFTDKADARPQLVAWDESGTQIVRSGELGSGVDLPSSDSVMIPMDGISSIDIEVRGDGKNWRGVFLDWMTSSDVVHPLNTEQRDVIPEPFSSLPPLPRPCILRAWSHARYLRHRA